MRLGFDARTALSPLAGGNTYFLELLPELLYLSAPQEEIVAFYYSRGDRPRQLPWMNHRRFRLVDRRVPVQVLNAAWRLLRYPRIESLCGPLDVFHNLYPTLSPSRAESRVLTLFDLDLLEHPEWMDKQTGRYHRRRIRRAVNESDVVIVPSQHTREQAQGHLGIEAGRIEIIPLGVSRRFLTPPRPAAVEAFCERFHFLQEPYFLAVGTLEPKNNLPFLIRAYAVARDRTSALPRLLVVGRKGADYDQICYDVDRHRLEGSVIIIDHIDAQFAPFLYRGAELLVHPALSEGFGLSILEAAASGVPVLANRRCGVLEFLRDGVVNPESSEEGWANEMLRLHRDQELRLEIGRRGNRDAEQWSWTRTAERHWQVYRQGSA